MKRLANILAAVVCALGGATFWFGRDVTVLGIRESQRGLGAYPSAEQINVFIFYPIAVVIAVLVGAWATNAAGRGFGWLIVLAAIALLGILIIFVAIYGNGV